MLNNSQDLELSKQILKKVIKLAQIVEDTLGRHIILMEVCGTHTTAISKSGLRNILASHMELRSGPGCPVCVTDQTDIDRILEMARIPDVVIATFGDMVRVPGTHSSLERERAQGAQVEIFYSPHEAVVYAAQHQDREIIFLGVGFETTIPVIALSIAEAKKQGIKNYSVLSVHKLVPPVMRALLKDSELHIDGFILPGHVCTITGRKVFDFIASEYNIPAAIAGFEPADIMQAIYILLEQILHNEAHTVNGYARLVHEDGNKKAQDIMGEFFQTIDASWRGFGLVPESGLALRKGFSHYDAATRFPVEIPCSPPPEGCSCGEVLKGKLNPNECPLFAETCTPSNPVGPCMVSSEGACAAYYQYE